MLLGVRNLIMRYPDDEGGAAGGEQTPPAKEKGGQKPQEDNEKIALAKALKEARENSVSKEEYEKVRAENKRLVSEIINGEGGADNGQQKAPEKDPDTVIKELREDLYGSKSSELSNLEFWEKTLALRKAVIEKGDPDPFLPVGAKISPDEDDVSKANNVAEVVEECIKEADGNSEVFTALLQSRTNNDSPQMVLRLKKLGIKF